MGGPGSSRWGSYERMEIIEHCLSISVFELNHLGFLRANVRASGKLVWQDDFLGTIGSVRLVLDTFGDRPQLRVIYYVAIWDRNIETIECEITLDQTRCFFGGQRFWFLCPLVKNEEACERRVAKLYLPPGEHHFGCRECHSLTYKSRQEKIRHYERPQFDMQLNGN